ncbi:ATP-binding protein [Promicromonospora sp. NPDC019610]|uniref:sensor histidine kinase n=1 Tax=Promicromonospora sp. NPDC019610 TaxID=3364405 RepID=UPI0037B74479
MATTFTTQVNRSIVAAMIVVSLLTLGLFALTGFNRLVQQTQESALRIAQTVAQTPGVRAGAEEESGRQPPSTDAELVAGTLDDYAREVEDRTGALFVVITDDTGRRLAHPRPDEIGDPVSTSPDAALRGEETVSWERGTLGVSARAKVPVYGLDRPGTVVGEVSVGLPPTEVWSTVLADAVPVVLSTALALGVGGLLARFITRRLRERTLGLQPEELLELVHDQQAVLQGVDDGVVGLSGDDVVTVCNDRAVALLGLDHPVGRRVEEAIGHAGVLARIEGARAAATTTETADGGPAAGPDAPPDPPLVVDGRLVYVDVHEVRREGRLLGRVVIVRDVTAVEDLSRRLTAVGTLAGALREQRHEFANRIHVVTGLVRAGDTAEALDYLGRIGEHGPVRFPIDDAGLVREPYLQAFLGAKALEAERQGVTLRVGPDADVSGSLLHPEDVTTVLGNLVDNGIAAAVASERTPRWVEVEALRHGDELHLSVMDSGDGAAADPFTPEALPTRVPGPGETGVGETGAGEEAGAAGAAHGHGIGLRLSAEVARRHGGELRLAMGRTERHGAVFVARLERQFEQEDGR